MPQIVGGPPGDASWRSNGFSGSDAAARGRAALAVTGARLELTREQILAFRRRVGALDERLPTGPESLRRAAWAGLQDSMPRAALLSIHARVAGTEATTWEDPSLVQIWGPRYSTYVVPKPDVAFFTLGRLPEDGNGRRVAEEVAAQLHAVLGGARMPDREAAAPIGVNPNRFRYAAATGTVLIRWEGARAPVIWSVTAPDLDPAEASLELARRYLHVFGPTTPLSFTDWAGIATRRGPAIFEALGATLLPVRTPLGDAWALKSDEAALRAKPWLSAPARLLPSGDAYFLLQGADRKLLVPEADRRPLLWTSRAWPGAVLVNGEIVGTWRRANAALSIEPWRPLTNKEQEAVEIEAVSLPLPGIGSSIRVRWSGLGRSIQSRERSH
jgi:winged helix DNA-binding protein